MLSQILESNFWQIAQILHIFPWIQLELILVHCRVIFSPPAIGFQSKLLELQLALVDVASVALRTGDGDRVTCRSGPLTCNIGEIEQVKRCQMQHCCNSTKRTWEKWQTGAEGFLDVGCWTLFLLLLIFLACAGALLGKHDKTSCLARKSSVLLEQSLPAKTGPVPGPRSNTVCAPFLTLSVASPQPTMAGMPSSRAMMAAWQVRPPRLVMMAPAFFLGD